MKALTGLMCVTKIPKDLIRKTKENGEPYKDNNEYLPVVIFISDKADKFGNVASIKVNTPKGDDRKIYLGNLKPVKKKQAHNSNQEEHNDFSF